MSYKSLAINLANCNCEADVVKLLKNEGYWDNPEHWRSFGDNDNNWSTIGNQQREADAALVEKLINSIDAMLMKECLIRGVSPESPNAPRSIADALEKYFGIKGGKIEELTQGERTKLAKSIVLAATGKKPSRGENTYPNITIVDSGEGQTPKQMPNTILSINKSNKLKVPFVQGKFNMGGTGVLRFCGENNIQLIISRRCPQINENGDDTYNQWGVTIIRRLRPDDGRRSSLFQYLTTTEKNIFSFDADEGLDIIPTSKGRSEIMHYGMFCKLFEYKMASKLCTNINMGLYYRLSTLLPNLAYPIYLDECRDYTGHTMYRTLSGLNVRLCDQTASECNNIEKKLSAQFTIEGQRLPVSTYIFKKTNAKGIDVDASQFRAEEGILLTQNGQTHGSFDRKFYKRNNVGLSYLADSILTIVDCSSINETTREDLFMNSRDRMSTGGFALKLEQDLEEYFKNNDILKRIQAKRREEAISNKLDDEKPLEDILNSVFKTSPVLSKLFITGERLQNPINLSGATENENYTGKYNPTYFTIISKHGEPVNKQAQIGRKFRIKFKTDACNDFFSREDNPGKYFLTCLNFTCENHQMNLYNGYATLSVSLPSSANVGDRLQFECVTIDTTDDHEFKNEFSVEIIEFAETPGGSGGRQLPSGTRNGGKSFKPTGIALPVVQEVFLDRWDEFGFDKTSALKIMAVGADKKIYDFFVNMDNVHLLSEIKPIAKDEARVKLFKARYKYSMVLIGLSILGYYDKDENNTQCQDSVEDIVEKFTKIISPVILPLIEVMGAADLIGANN